MGSFAANYVDRTAQHSRKGEGRRKKKERGGIRSLYCYTLTYDKGNEYGGAQFAGRLVNGTY